MRFGARARVTGAFRSAGACPESAAAFGFDFLRVAHFARLCAQTNFDASGTVFLNASRGTCPRAPRAGGAESEADLSEAAVEFDGDELARHAGGGEGVDLRAERSHCCPGAPRDRRAGARRIRVVG